MSNPTTNILPGHSLVRNWFMACLVRKPPNNVIHLTLSTRLTHIWSIGGYPPYNTIFLQWLTFCVFQPTHPAPVTWRFKLQRPLYNWETILGYLTAFAIICQLMVILINFAYPLSTEKGQRRVLSVSLGESSLSKNKGIAWNLWQNLNSQALRYLCMLYPFATPAVVGRRKRCRSFLVQYDFHLLCGRLSHYWLLIFISVKIVIRIPLLYYLCIVFLSVSSRSLYVNDNWWICLFFFVGLNDICGQKSPVHDVEATNNRRPKRHRQTDWAWLQACLGMNVSLIW